MATHDQDLDDRIPTSFRTLLILEAFVVARRPLTPTEINATIGLPKQTIHRLCARMAEEGFLVFDAAGKRLTPARRARLLGAGLLHVTNREIARHQILESVSREIGETINLVVPDTAGMRYLDRVETDWPFRVQLPIGTHVPFHCTASGKAFLSCLPSAERSAMVQSLTLTAATVRSITQPKKLLDELKRIARRGYSLDEEEFMDGMVAIAVPIRDSEGRFIAALACHGPTIRMTLKRAVASKETLIGAARKLAGLMLES